MSVDLRDSFNLDAYGTSFGNDDDDRYEIYPTRSLYGLSKEDTEESLAEGAPPFSSWKVPRDACMRVTVDMAREESLKQLVKEVEFIDSKLTRKFGSRQPCFDVLIEEFFGVNSDMHQVFKKHLPNCTFERYSRWLTTLFVCLAYGKSIEDLFSEYSFIDKTGLASPEEYKALWKVSPLHDWMCQGLVGQKLELT